MTKRFSMSAFQLTLYAVGFVLLFAALVFVTYYPPADGGPQLLNWLYGTLGILAGHILGTKQGLAKGDSPGGATSQSAQVGRAHASMLPVLVAVGIACALMLSGCASITEAGHSSYTVHAVTDSGGKVQGHDLDVKDGKEYTEGRTVRFQSTAEETTLVIQEGPSKAFTGQAISAKALSVFPVTDLANILSGGGGKAP